jgi:phosphoribosylanthranilate isomerase
MHDSYSEEFISDFIKAFEVNKEKKIASAKPRKKKAEATVFDEFLEKENADTDSSTN